MHGLPSPADSPSSIPADLTTPVQSRKRQRSVSMDSEHSSASVKRSASEGPSNGSGVLNSEDHNKEDREACEIDAYMAEQGEADQDTITLQYPYPSSDELTVPQKLVYIKERRNRPMAVGDTWYIVSRQWYRRWEAACEGRIDKDGSVEEKDVGPVDNSSLVDKDKNLTSSLVEGIDVEFLPEDAWQSLVMWYGQPVHPLPRKVIARGVLQEPTLELRPPRLKALILKNLESGDVAGPPPCYVTLSTKDSLKRLCRELITAVSPQVNAPYRVWKVDPAELSGSQIPVSKFSSYNPKLLEESDRSLEDSLIEPDDPFVVEFQENGAWLVDATQVTSSAADMPPPLFSSENDFFSRLGNRSSSSFGAGTQSTLLSSTKTFTPAKPSASTSTGFTRSLNKPIQMPGTLGLGNMGNTCFMNSALQCLAHNKELMDYFLFGVYHQELNPDNPLGMQGAIAEAFGALVDKIWATNSTMSSYSPREFKMALQRFAPQFSGYQQHDSQELVAFLLDGLHEDLNRVLKKPYVEKPDWDGGGDVELVQLAQKSWDGYKLRNDSVIVDLFQGQYQSTLVCPECQKISITFDPFMYLTLPLPITKKWRGTVYYVPWDTERPHYKVLVEVGRDSSFKELRNQVGKYMNTPPENLLTLEIFNNRFYKSLDDNVLVGDMSDKDIIVCFELPCHAQQSRTYKKKPEDPILVPVFLTDIAPTRSTTYSFNRGPSYFGYPFIIAVEQEEAKTVEDIYAAAVHRLQRWTDQARDLFRWEVGPVVAPIQITGSAPPKDTLTEIKENGDVIPVAPEEGDIADQKNVLHESEVVEEKMDTTADEDVPHIVGVKPDIFNLRLQINHRDFGSGFGGYGATAPRYETWEDRQKEVEDGSSLLREGDALFCEFDENMKAYYFGEGTQNEHARWDAWEFFEHPDLIEASKAAAEKKNITLGDCLAEFTKEEQLGEDDLWYCPKCKKHQQATKKFTLWNAPDILVVHLKRFSNSRAMRDKIDALVDFPIEALDLTDMVGERKATRRLAESGVDVQTLGLENDDDPLLYDLFAVDEHLGGLGGGHYRAYAHHYGTDKWYHFDDSYVTESTAEQSVNANAYLLFYQRRSSRPLGGKSHTKIQEFRQKVQEEQLQREAAAAVSEGNQLPTPPSESTTPAYVSTRQTSVANTGWLTPQSNSRSSPDSSPPPPDEGDPPLFEELEDMSSNPLEHVAARDFDFPDPSNLASPSSSVEAEPDRDDEHIENLNSPDMGWPAPGPVASTQGEWVNDDADPFSDANSQGRR
ncbi:cysteine proteinase [Coniophora puteana RWD-64-598 SS2]|uniref:ubiquitinyl hydrolase 1 n=1 Tax=Coniophora puteana (strain RWD-64-598) TaxID=741705 RepID=A0A5M3MJM2_CONPW|nr:cysteine proteinase [Coniophora puteana RWD-64-598 SS2]EIW79313.1 cysteine proteinase [Coniophora puteana RWD-64-598 SS2]